MRLIHDFFLQDGTERWLRWEELVHLLWMLLLSYNKAMKGETVVNTSTVFPAIIIKWLTIKAVKINRTSISVVTMGVCLRMMNQMLIIHNIISFLDIQQTKNMVSEVMEYFFVQQRQKRGQK